MKLYNKLSYYRRLRGISQKQLADLIGVTPGTISHYESGRRLPNIQMALKLAQILEVSVEDLFSPEIIQDEMSSETKYTSPSRQG